MKSLGGQLARLDRTVYSVYTICSDRLETNITAVMEVDLEVVMRSQASLMCWR